MRPVAIDPEEAKWRRRSDARTLAEAEQIKGDKERYKGSIQGAREIAQERLDEAKSICKVAGMKTPKTPASVPPKPTGNTIPTATQPFDKRGYRNPATIGRF